MISMEEDPGGSVKLKIRNAYKKRSKASSGPPTTYLPPPQAIKPKATEQWNENGQQDDEDEKPVGYARGRRCGSDIGRHGGRGRARKPR